MSDTPHIIQTADQHIAVIHVTVAMSEIRQVMGPTISELYAAIAAQGIAPAGPWFTHHLRRPTDSFDFEVGVPVASPVSAAGRMKPSRWPAMKVARSVYRGPYEGLGGAWGGFIKWVADQGHTTTPDLWEQYVVGPESGGDASTWRTELNLPLMA